MKWNYTDVAKQPWKQKPVVRRNGDFLEEIVTLYPEPDSPEFQGFKGLSRACLLGWESFPPGEEPGKPLLSNLI